MDRKESRQLNYTKTRALPNTKIILHLHQVLKIIGCEGLCQIRGQVNKCKIKWLKFVLEVYLRMERTKGNPAAKHKTSKYQNHTYEESGHTWSRCLQSL